MWIRERGDMTESRHNIATKQDGKPLPSSVGQKSAAPLTMYTLKMTGTDSAGFIVTMPCGPIQDEFERMVDALITELASRFGNKLDGIYLYGSIARGNARPNDSDLDVTLCEVCPNECNKLEYILEQANAPDPETDIFTQRVSSFSDWLKSASNIRESL